MRADPGMAMEMAQTHFAMTRKTIAREKKPRESGRCRPAQQEKPRQGFLKQKRFVSVRTPIGELAAQLVQHA